MLKSVSFCEDSSLAPSSRMSVSCPSPRSSFSCLKVYLLIVFLNLFFSNYLIFFLYHLIIES